MCADWVFRMLFAGIAAVRLEHEQRKFGSNTDEMGKRKEIEGGSLKGVYKKPPPQCSQHAGRKTWPVWRTPKPPSVPSFSSLSCNLRFSFYVSSCDSLVAT